MRLIDVLNNLLAIQHFNIIFDPIKRISNQNTVLIGLGNKEEGICLNHKGTMYKSVSELVYRASKQMVSQWRLSLNNPNNPDKAIYYLEDLSPDTCLAFILFYCRIHDVPLEEIPSEWVSYVSSWESGDVKTTGAPFTSWGCLHSALGHAYFTNDSKKSNAVLNNQNFVLGFLTCLRFDIKLLLEKIRPFNVPELYHLEEVYSCFKSCN